MRRGSCALKSIRPAIGFTTSSPVDAAKRAAAVEEHGLELALEHLSKRR